MRFKRVQKKHYKKEILKIQIWLNNLTKRLCAVTKNTSALALIYLPAGTNKLSKYNEHIKSYEPSIVIVYISPHLQCY